MSRYIKTQITQLSANEQAALDALNKNFNDLQDAITDTVSRSGNTPTHMTNNLDMNGKRLINVPEPLYETDVVRKKDVAEDLETIQQLTQQAINAGNAAIESAQTATSAAVNAADSAVSAEASATTAANKADEASTSATNAHASEVNANASADLAEGYKNTAVQSKDDAEAAKNTAVAQATIATNKASEASGSASTASQKATDASNSATAAHNSEVAASQSEQAASDYLDESKQWAIGEPSEPEGHSSKWWAEHSGLPDQTGHNGKFLQTDGSGASWNNIPHDSTKQDVTTALNYNNISNCITYIPQDIKLELNNGMLTLKAGSKVYSSSGVWKVMSYDSSVSWGYSGSGFVFVKSNGGLAVNSTGSESVSTLPTPATTYKIFYNTTDGKCYFDSNNSQMEEISFPIATFTADNGIKSIDQVFNGFGYIGSTVFALPGVKGLIPNGRNTDGSLKSIEYTNTSVKTYTSTVDENSVVNLYDGSIGIDFASYTYQNFFIQCEKPTQMQYMLWLDTNNNEFKFTDNYGSSWTKVNLFNIGFKTTTGGKITSFKPKTTFHALDYNDNISSFVISNYSAGPATTGSDSTGYIKFTNGLIICWGYVFLNSVISSSNKRVTYPTPYTHTPCVYVTNDANAGAQTPITIGWQGTTAFSVGTLSGYTSTGHVSWLSIGY